MCEVEGCTEGASYGFRQTIDTTNYDSVGRAKEFIVGIHPNWCFGHDGEMREKYTGLDGFYVDLTKA